MAAFMINRIWCARQTRTQALQFSGKIYAFLVSPRQKPSWRQLNTLGQKQYLAREVGVKFFNSSLMNKLIRIEWVSAIRLPTKLMDVTSSMSKKTKNRFSIYNAILAPCPDPGVLGSGSRIGDDFRHAKSVTFTCKEDYELEGDATISCNNGDWTSKTPLCKGMYI